MAVGGEQQRDREQLVEPAEHRCWLTLENGSYSVARVKPPNRSISSPAAWTAANSSWATKPSASPTTDLAAGRPASTGPSSGRRGLVDQPRSDRQREGDGEGDLDQRAGSARLLNGGATTSQAETRTSRAGRPAAARSAACERHHGTAASVGEQLRAACRTGRWVKSTICAEHPVAGEQDDQADADQLGHEGERDLLDLGDRLEQRDGEADGEASRAGSAPASLAARIIAWTAMWMTAVSVTGSTCSDACGRVRVVAGDERA